MLSREEAMVLEELYFPAPLHALGPATGLTAPEINRAILLLLQKELVTQLYFDEQQKDFLPCDPVQANHPDRFQYVATRKGLLALTGA